MKKLPQEFNEEDLKMLRFKQLKIYVGPLDRDEISNVIEGQIIKYGLAANPPHLPIDIEIKLTDGKKRTLNIFDVKRVEYK